MLIKEAAKSLYDKKQITQEEYDFIEKNAKELEKVSLNIPTAGNVLKGANRASPIFDSLRNVLIGATVGSAAITGGTELYNALLRQGKIKNSFDLMQEKVPQLKEYPQDQVRDYFEVVKTFSPMSATNPLVAGALVHKMLEFGGVDHKLVQDISKIELTPQSGFMYEMAKSLGGLAKFPKD